MCWQCVGPKRLHRRTCAGRWLWCEETVGQMHTNPCACANADVGARRSNVRWNIKVYVSGNCGIVFVVFLLGSSCQRRTCHSSDLTYAPYKEENHSVHMCVHMYVCMHQELKMFRCAWPLSNLLAIQTAWRVSEFWLPMPSTEKKGASLLYKQSVGQAVRSEISGDHRLFAPAVNDAHEYHLHTPE